MSANWKAGDKALCIHDDWDERRWAWTDSGPQPKKSCVYLVSEVVDDGDGLQFAGHSCHVSLLGRIFTSDIEKDSGGYASECFRKIVPACDRVTIESEQEVSP